MTGCADKHLDYLTDYSNHRPLRVTGHPSTGSLETVQRVVWRLADGDVDGLAALNTEGGDSRPAARAWIKAYGKAAARDEVTADFDEEGSVRQTVVLHFTGPDRPHPERHGADRRARHLGNPAGKSVPPGCQEVQPRSDYKVKGPAGGHEPRSTTCSS